MANSMRLGGGGRFNALQAALAQQGASNPGALAAVIGRKKYGAKKMASMAAKGRKRKQPAEESAAGERGESAAVEAAEQRAGTS